MAGPADSHLIFLGGITACTYGSKTRNEKPPAGGLDSCVRRRRVRVSLRLQHNYDGGP